MEGRRFMRRALLEVVACRAVSTPHEVMRFIKCTLLAATTSYEVRRTLFPYMAGTLGTEALQGYM